MSVVRSARNGFGPKILAILFRWQLAYPGQSVPVIGGCFGDLNAPGGLSFPSHHHRAAARARAHLGIVDEMYGRRTS